MQFENIFSFAKVARKDTLKHQTDQQVVGDELINDFSGHAVSHYNGHTIMTDSVDSYFDWLTRAQAAALAADLMDFAQGREVEDV